MKIAVVPSSNKEIDKYTSPLVSTIIFGLKDFSVNYYTLNPVKKQALIKTQEKFIKKINEKIKLLS